MSNGAPPKGAMYLYDYALPPLPPGEYKLVAATAVDYTGGSPSLSGDRYFDVVGPRFILNPGDIGGVSPPRNGRGPFASLLPQISLRRRTLPWERQLGAIQPA